jgi:hypothetical protein
MKIKQGFLYLYKKSDSDWAVVQASETTDQIMITSFSGQVIACSDKLEFLFSNSGIEAKRGVYSGTWPIKLFKAIPNCQISFTCKPKKPKKGEKLTVEGQVFFG